MRVIPALPSALPGVCVSEMHFSPSSISELKPLPAIRGAVYHPACVHREALIGSRQRCDRLPAPSCWCHWEGIITSSPHCLPAHAPLLTLAIASGRCKCLRGTVKAVRVWTPPWGQCVQEAPQEPPHSQSLIEKPPPLTLSPSVPPQPTGNRPHWAPVLFPC